MNIRSSNTRRFGVGAISVLAIAIAATSFSASAATSTSNLTVTATVAAACTITADALSFGTTVDVTPGTAIAGASTLSALCTNGSAYTVGLGVGGATGATVTTREMTSTTGGTGTLAYTLSSVAAGGINWDDIGGTTVVSGTGTGAAQSIPVYGQITAAQTDVVADSYSDSVIATISF